MNKKNMLQTKSRNLILLNPQRNKTQRQEILILRRDTMRRIIWINQSKANNQKNQSILNRLKKRLQRMLFQIQKTKSLETLMTSPMFKVLLKKRTLTISTRTVFICPWLKCLWKQQSISSTKQVTLSSTIFQINSENQIAVCPMISNPRSIATGKKRPTCLKMSEVSSILPQCFLIG